ncbi:hypothetical protein HAX54_030251, partial [Datura stramonium]|nr:hypothetical protein [Datura stramonium]
MGTTTIGYSLTRSGETQMKCRFGKKLALGDCFDPPLHRHFVNRDWRFADESPMEKLLTQSRESLPAIHQNYVNAASSFMLIPPL